MPSPVRPTGPSSAADDPAQLGQPLCDVPLGAVPAGLVVVPPDQLVRRVLLGQYAIGLVVRVPVALGVTELGRARWRTGPAVPAG